MKFIYFPPNYTVHCVTTCENYYNISHEVRSQNVISLKYDIDDKKMKKKTQFNDISVIVLLNVYTAICTFRNMTHETLESAWWVLMAWCLSWCQSICKHHDGVDQSENIRRHCCKVICVCLAYYSHASWTSSDWSARVQRYWAWEIIHLQK